jgi:hypothetical protein
MLCHFATLLREDEVIEEKHEKPVRGENGYMNRCHNLHSIYVAKLSD